MHKLLRASRGIPVWGERLREIRKQCGWTQFELASRSGYCERLVRKAELNGRVSEETLEVLAITLSTPNNPVTVADLTLTPQSVPVDFYQAIYRPDPKNLIRLEAFVVNDLIIDCSAVDQSLPMNGIYCGKNGLHEWYDTVCCLAALAEFHDDDCVLIDNEVHAYFHAVWTTTSNLVHPLMELDIDLRMHFENGRIAKIVWLSSLAGLKPIAAQWDVTLVELYRNRILRIHESLYASESA